MASHSFDIVLVGGGLQSSLVALAACERLPEARIAIVERGSALGGYHTWCVHGDDVPEAAKSFVDALSVQRWERWEVRFPQFRQTFDTPYLAVSSAQLQRVVSQRLADNPGHALWLGSQAIQVDETSVRLSSGDRLEAPLVIDARGTIEGEDGSPALENGACGYQKFFGLELELSEPSSLSHPLLMDACVEQHDGFRFVYVLPFAATSDAPARVLIEDTYFSDTPEIDETLLRDRAMAHAQRLGLRTGKLLRTERGALPLPLSWRYANLDVSRGPLLAGNRGGFFHPTTGYSFPIALRLALQLTSAPLSQARGPELLALVRAHHEQARFAVMLNRLLFKASLPGNRREVLERFHQLPAATIGRFYGLRTTARDRLRILCGRPPAGMSLRRALREAMSS